MVTLDLNDEPALLKALREGRVNFSTGPDRRINWGLVVTIVIAIVGWLFVAAGTGAGDYAKVRDRVTTLEVQRTEDVRQRLEQRAEDAKWRDQVDRKLDRLVDRVAPQGGR